LVVTPQVKAPIFIINTARMTSDPMPTLPANTLSTVISHQTLIPLIHLLAIISAEMQLPLEVLVLWPNMNIASTSPQLQAMETNLASLEVV
jgi:hypothetical protein